MNLADLLVEQGVVSAETLAPYDTQRSDLWLRLVDDAGIRDDDILKAVARHYRCDAIKALPDDALESDLIRPVPVDYARQNRVLPIRYQGGLALLTANPADGKTLQDVGLLLDDDPVPVIASPSVIEDAIDAAYFQQVHDTRSSYDGDDESVAAILSDNPDLLRSSDEAPVTKIVNGVLLQAIQDNASDIHIEPFSSRLRLRYRVDGRLHEQPDLPKQLEASLTSRLKIMARLDIAEKRLPQDGVARVSVGEREIDIRVSTIPVAEGERIVLRLLRHDTSLLPLSELGMSPAVLEDFARLLREPHGVIWVTGPTGSGKTTTLYSALSEVDTTTRNVMTIEDPVEYQLPDIGQISVKPKIGLTFASGLRSILRQDPDIVLVGETRDTETAEIVIQASLTGHLVFSTLHTNDAIGSIMRLVDMGVEPYLVAEACRAAMAQRLVRRLDLADSKALVVEDTHIQKWGSWASPLKGETIQVAGHANAYKGRLGVYELIVFDDELQQAIRDGEDRASLVKHALRVGGHGMAADALDKVRAGLTDPEEVAVILGRR